MRIVRTPDDHFENLPDFHFTPHYVDVNGLRVHYIDEGGGDPITRVGDRFFRHLIATATDHPGISIKDADHFLQEEKGEESAQHILEFISRS